MTTWLHRISYSADASYRLLDCGWLSIGFSDLASDDFIPGIVSEGMPFMDSRMVDVYGKTWKAKWSLWYFVRGMKKGDRVVVPSWGTFSVYEVMDDLPISLVSHEARGLIDGICVKTDSGMRFEEPNRWLRADNSDMDLGFFRRVRPVSDKSLNIPRCDYCDAALTSRMKIRVTTADISDLERSVDDSLNAFAHNCPRKLYSQVGQAMSDILLDAVKSQLNPDKFEALIKWYFLRVGATEVTIPAKNERGKEGDADIIATFEPLRAIFYVQAKFQQGQVSDWGAKQVIDYVNNVKAELSKRSLVNDSSVQDDCIRNSWLVSTCDSFSDECLRVAQENNLLLVSGKDFAGMLIKAGLSGIDSVA